jgi:hypothetical protein
MAIQSQQDIIAKVTAAAATAAAAAVQPTATVSTPAAAGLSSGQVKR